MRGKRVLAACLLAVLVGADKKDDAPSILPPDGSIFRKQVKVIRTDTQLIIQSDGIPDHKTGDFPNARNPNTIRKQNYTFKIPLKPKIADKVTPLPMGPIGVAINGVPFYNPWNAEGQDAAKNEVFDECCGHPDQGGRYHYHIYPKCVKTPFSDKKGEHSPIIGYMFDGIGVYGPFGEKGVRPTDLDECNGHSDPDRGYHYHVTDKFPYIVGGYRGEVDLSNLDRRGPNGERQPPGVEPGDRPPPPQGGRRPPPPPR